MQKAVDEQVEQEDQTKRLKEVQENRDEGKFLFKNLKWGRIGMLISYEILNEMVTIIKRDGEE